MLELAADLLPLRGRRFDFSADRSVGGGYAASVLARLGADVCQTAPGDGVDAALAWAECGLMMLCGEDGERPRQGPGAIPSCARGVLRALGMLAPTSALQSLDGARLLTERAALLGLSAQGRVSPNLGCHLLASKDGWIALNLAREQDWALLPAWLQTTVPPIDWPGVEGQVRGWQTQSLVERGRLLGLPVAAAQPAEVTNEPWLRIHRAGKPRAMSVSSRPLVVDLSSLWAGPLCGHLLLQAGARVIKVESVRRLDGARGGNAEFFNVLNADKESVAFDLSSAAGQRQLLCLLQRADIVIEGSRPRALLQMGIDAQELVSAKPGLVWLGISAYGRAEPAANWVGFGDDVAVSAGVATACADPPIFCGDALADPLTGMHAALVALAFWQAGEGALIDLSLRNVTAHCLNYRRDIPRGVVVRDGQYWLLDVEGFAARICAPEQRLTEHCAAEAGTDTQAVLREFAIQC
jgi:crotonobetainyl-CoA:carnitine CoA-transferase CaiB-like acyl-CoA transferase